LWTYAHHGVCSGQPTRFESPRSSVTTYSEALNRVQRRFWTTSFLSSGFWGGSNGEVIKANRHMLSRLAAAGDARRLFLMQQPLEQEAEAHKDQLVLDRKYGRQRAVADRMQQFRQFQQSVAQLRKEGCKVRVAFDRDALYRRLPTEFKFDPADSELAIYDDWRVDVFGGGSTGRISGVSCYTPATEHFAAYLDTAEQYFEQLWNAASDVDELVAKVREAHEDAESRIDYESNWLAFYEFALPAQDAALKTVEIARVAEILRAHGKWGALGRCLDIGTCTGRYPIFLRDGLSADGSIVGVDEDIDCVRFAAANVGQRCGSDPRIQVIKADFRSRTLELPGPFELITCMVGTASHFGKNRDRSDAADKSDTLQQVLERMASLLAPDGLLVLSTWSELACATRTMLGIYRESDRQRLADWTPPIAELRARLRRANLEIVETAHPEPRLDLTVCRPAARAVAAVAA
jgi:SAM-dependent methyltransferase